MPKHKVLTTDAEIDAALARAAEAPEKPYLESIQYRPGRGLDLFILHMSDGQRYLLPREKLQGLQTATREQAANIEILGKGTGLYWPDLDAALYVPSLVSGVYGNRAWMAKLGQIGGSQTSPRKTQASRANGLKGGRPKRVTHRESIAA